MSVNQPGKPVTELEKWASVNLLSPFSELENLYRLTKFDAILNAQTLNTLKKQLNLDFPHQFTDQDNLADTNEYYEQIIFNRSIVPTRNDSWHDLFNGLIWLAFPKTKALLNSWHMRDIEKHGLHPRNARRNRITHFDECGVILVTSNSALLSALRQHQFKKAFHEMRVQWGRDVQATVFGHANYEMLMDPFIGLTGKWVAIPPCQHYFEMPRSQQLAYIDEALSQRLQAQNDFSERLKMYPFPLLGTPGWYADNQVATFYNNQDYFRPIRVKEVPKSPAVSMQ